jgi:uncharacterized protein YgiM (DUF1202 family)
VLTATARTSDSQWVRVLLPTGQEAWVFRDTVNATPAVTSLPGVAVPTPTPAPAVPTPAVAPTATPAAATAPAVATATVRQLVITVYDAPAASADALVRPKRGAKLDVMGRNAAGDWLQVTAEDGTVGWVTATGVAVSVDVATLPVVQ